MADHTPESDLGSIECFQNYTAPEVFVQGLAGTVDQQDVECIIRAQKQMLQRFEKTNEMLSNCNTLCMTRLKTAAGEFKKHTQILNEMRKDLDNVFRRIQTIKTKIASQYPQNVPEKPSIAEASSENNEEIVEESSLETPAEERPQTSDLDNLINKQEERLSRNSSSSETISHDSSLNTSESA